MKDKNKDDLYRLKEEVMILREENINLKEKLQLQKSNWLFSHHLLLSVCLAATYGLTIPSLVYFITYVLDITLPYNSNSSLYLVLGFFIIFGIPVISPFPPVLLLRSPRFATNALRGYVFFFILFETLVLYWDPLQRISSNPQGIAKLSEAFNVSVLIGLFLAASVVLAVATVRKCGYRTILSGSARSFTANADVNIVLEQLKKLEEDFNLTLERKTSNSLYFVKTYGNKKSVLQFLLRSTDGRTDGVMVMHSVENDVPMKPDPKELKRISETLLKWLATSTGLEVAGTENGPLIDEALQESKRGFYRQAVALPSRKSAKKFLEEHWKDIGLIVSVVVAVVAWLFPR